MDTEIYKILQEWHELYKSGAITETEFIKKKQELLGKSHENEKVEKPVAPKKVEDTTVIPDQNPLHREESDVANAPYPWQETPDNTDSSSRMKKNKVLFIILPLPVVLFIIIYIFFLRPNPAADGKKAADAFCNCTEQYDSAMIAAGNTFINTFSTFNFQTRQAAADQWQQIQNPINNEYANCKNAAQDLEGRLSSKYNSNNNQYNTFQAALSSENGSGDMQNQSEVASLESDVQNKIASIVTAIPNINQIASDLINRNFQTWPSQGSEQLTSPDQWTIQNVNQTNNSVNFIIDLGLIGPVMDVSNQMGHIYAVEILVNYVKDDQNWLFSYDKVLKVTLSYTVTPDSWTNAIVEPKSNFSIDSKGHKYWVQGKFGDYYKGGPDVPPVKIVSDTLGFQSRDGSTFQLYITYTPTN